jgi:hypothetical protein
MFAAIRRASSLLSNLAADRRLAHPRNRSKRVSARCGRARQSRYPNSPTDQGGGKRRAVTARYNPPILRGQLRPLSAHLDAIVTQGRV